MKRLCLLAAMLLAACRAISKPEAEPAASSTPASSGATGSPEPVLSVVYQGECSVAVIGHVGPAPALLWSRGADRAIYALGDGLPTLLLTLPGGQGMVASVGGIDAAHLWVESGSPSRTNSTFNDVRLANGSHQALGPAADRTLIEQPDGSLWIWSGDPSRKKLQAYDTRTGEAIPRNMPGLDMTGAHRLDNGELLAAGRTKNDEVVLRRWSPVRPVPDLIAPGSTGPLSIELRLGSQLAVLGVPGDHPHFYVYDGYSLHETKLASTMPAPTSWTITKADDLIAIDATGEMWAEHADGTIAHAKGPELGVLASTSKLPWLLGQSGALYTRSGTSWVRVGLPAGPWTSEKAGPRHIEWVQERGAETLVLVKHTEPDATGKPHSVDTLYSTVARAKPFRCGAPFEPFGYAPPRAQ